MSVELISLLMFGSLVVCLILGVPLAFALGTVGVAFVIFIWGPAGLLMIGSTVFGPMINFILVALPLFIFMANMLERSGIADDLYEMMYHWMGPLRGGLAIGTVAICTIFAAMAGISGAATVTMGVIALPSLSSSRTNPTGC